MAVRETVRTADVTYYWFSFHLITCFRRCETEEVAQWNMQILAVKDQCTAAVERTSTFLSSLYAHEILQNRLQHARDLVNINTADVYLPDHAEFPPRVI